MSITEVVVRFIGVMHVKGLELCLTPHLHSLIVTYYINPWARRNNDQKGGVLFSFNFY